MKHMESHLKYKLKFSSISVGFYECSFCCFGQASQDLFAFAHLKSLKISRIHVCASLAKGGWLVNTGAGGEITF